MYCSVLDHNVHILTGSYDKFTRCCLMKDKMEYDTIYEMENDQEVANIKNMLANDIWPKNCEICRLVEQSGKVSGRLRANTAIEMFKDVPNYIILNISEGNKCNSACQTCHSEASSLIATLSNKHVENYSALGKLREIDPTRLVALSISGGEPSITKSVIDFLKEDVYKFNLAWLRLNTNGSRYFEELEQVLAANLKITLMLSMDGVENTFEYSRWPINWDKFQSNVGRYRQLRDKHDILKLGIVSVITCFNAFDYENVLNFVEDNKLVLATTVVQQPEILKITKNNFLTRYAKDILSKSSNPQVLQLASIVATESNDSTDELIRHIRYADKLRSISFNDYYEKYELKI